MSSDRGTSLWLRLLGDAAGRPAWDVRTMTCAQCPRCGAERPTWLGEPHRCMGDANLSWLAFHEMTAHAAMAWRRGLLDGTS